jgi:hypothetical protein
MPQTPPSTPPAKPRAAAPPPRVGKTRRRARDLLRRPPGFFASAQERLEYAARLAVASGAVDAETADAVLAASVPVPPTPP